MDKEERGGRGEEERVKRGKWGGRRKNGGGRGAV